MESNSMFRQRVFTGGYTWHDFSRQYKKSVPILLLIDPRRTEKDVLRIEDYRKVFEEDDVVTLPNELFMIFSRVHMGDDAEVEQTLDDAEIRERLRERILQFANIYGFLGISCGLELSGQPIHAETADAWYDASEKMSRAWTYFDLVKKCQQAEAFAIDGLAGARQRRAKEQLELLYKRESDRIRSVFNNAPDFSAYCDLADRESSRLSLVNTEAAVLAYVGHIVDKELRKHTSMGLTWDYAGRKLATQYRVQALIGALWGQLMEYMTQLKGINFCKRCGAELRIMKVEGKRSRSDKQHCPGGACQKAARRQGQRVRSYKKKPRVG